MVTFTPFRLILKMRTPVILAEHPPHLDALLSFALFAHKGEQVISNLSVELDKYLDKDASTGVYRASALSFGVTPEQGLTATTITRSGVLRDGQLNSTWFKPHGKKSTNKYPRLVTEGGPTKSRFNTKEAFAAPYIVFDAVGRKEAIRRLLEYYLVGVGHEGFNAGFGSFESVTAIDLESDSSWFRDGKQVRYLPTELLPESKVSFKARATPPYWRKENEVNITPSERVNIIPLMELNL